jgi:hypothetical protein
VFERTSTTERYVRGFTAAVIAVTALVLAANAGPARAAERQPAQHTEQAGHIERAPYITPWAP